MTLEKIYLSLKGIIDKVDFQSLWDGLLPMKFALYNNDECYFDGGYIEKTKAFIGNTAIKFEGEVIAIWHIVEDVDIDILASKIIHEMFHGFQMLNDESRFPNELESLQKYDYNSLNLSMKLEENKLINKVLNQFNEDEYRKFLSLRKYRQENFQYEYMYEASIEQVEGSATYVELNALKQISYPKYEKLLKNMLEEIINPSNFLPIRIVSYSIGALIFELVSKNELFKYMSFLHEPISTSLVLNVLLSDEEIPLLSEIETLVEEYETETKEIIDKALSSNQIVLEGEYELLGVNVYNARRFEEYIVSRYFVMYLDGDKQSELYGNFVIKMNLKQKIAVIYEIVA